MRKKILSESKRMKELAGLKKMNESYGDSNNYQAECSLDINYYKVLYKGMEINDILSPKIKVNFNIEIEGRSWGIKNIGLYNVKGPSEIEIEIYYLTEQDQELEDYITLTIDWDKVIMEKNDSLEYIGIDNTISVDLINDENGEIKINQITVDYNDI